MGKEAKDLRVDVSRLREHFFAMARIGATPEGGVTRLALTDEDKAGRDLYLGWLKAAGLAHRLDDVGNIYGRREGSDPTAPAVMLGSHLDTVTQGGKYDGTLGVMAALEVVRTLNDAGIRTRHPLELTVFTNEEGARFQPALLAAGVVAGKFDLDYAYSRTDSGGKTFGSELERIGYKGSRANRPGPLKAYLEFHIEQGPVLEAAGLSVGVVEGIQGQIWLEVTVSGQADHAGPTPMPMRRDSLVAAARIIAGIRNLAYLIDPEAVTTVGRIKVQPDIINVIPGRTVFTIDIRHPRDELVDLGTAMARRTIERICREERVECRVEEMWRMPTTRFDPVVVDAVERATRELGYSYRRMMSGAGHDAKYMADIAPTGMIFVPTVNGKSHCEEEAAPWEDIEKGANVLLQTTLALAGVD